MEKANEIYQTFPTLKCCISETFGEHLVIQYISFRNQIIYLCTYITYILAACKSKKSIARAIVEVSYIKSTSTVEKDYSCKYKNKAKLQHDFASHVTFIYITVEKTLTQ